MGAKKVTVVCVEKCIVNKYYCGTTMVQVINVNYCDNMVFEYIHPGTELLPTYSYYGIYLEYQGTPKRSWYYQSTSPKAW